MSKNIAAKNQFEKCITDWNWSEGAPGFYLETDDLPAIDAKKFHKFLGIDDAFSRWLKSSLKKLQYEIDADEDCHARYNSDGTRIVGYVLSIRAAREIAALSHSERGIEALKELKTLQWRVDCRNSNDHLNEMWELLYNPVFRRIFAEAYHNLYSDYGVSRLYEMASHCLLTEQDELHQSILNDVFPKERADGSKTSIREIPNIQSETRFRYFSKSIHGVMQKSAA